jgi:hypothetical protein
MGEEERYEVFPFKRLTKKQASPQDKDHSGHNANLRPFATLIQCCPAAATDGCASFMCWTVGLSMMWYATVKELPYGKV